MSDFLYGSVGYFTYDSQTCVMNNLTIENPEFVEAHYAKLKEEIKDRLASPAEKEQAFQNLEKAYMIIKVKLCGAEDEEHGS